MKILIVEDEPETGDYLRKGLSEAGFRVDLARDGLDGLHLATTGDHDLLVLDVMLPRLDGWALLQALRLSGSAMPVLFLTARDQVEDRVRGLELGADDYLVKPFAFSELLARVRSLLRRGKVKEPEGVLTAADLELDLLRRRALSNLLSNALRHTPAGGCVDISIKAQGDRARLSVRNPGPTIAPDRLPLLFDRFHRVDPERSGHGEGAGLGLAITRSIVEAHGGDIAVESEHGSTTFVLHLPLAPVGAIPNGANQGLERER